MPRHTLTFRVRYDEADQMGVVHHSRYLTYFEMGRVELMRHLGLPHLEQEERGQPMSIRRIDVRYLSPARYDDVLELSTEITEARGARVTFKGRLVRLEGGKGPSPAAATGGRGGAEKQAEMAGAKTLIAEAVMEAATITPQGRVRRLSTEELAALAADDQQRREVLP